MIINLLLFFISFQVCENLEIICETEYFGLRKPVESISSTPLTGNASLTNTTNNINTSNPANTTTTTTSTTYEWINLRNPLPQNVHNNGRLEFRVKFWVPPHLILQDSVRNIFYMQARLDLLQGRLRPANWSKSAQLSALLAQADRLKYDEAALTAAVPTISTTTAASSSNDSKSLEPTKCKKRRLSRHKLAIEAAAPVIATTGNQTNALTPYEAYVLWPEDCGVTGTLPDGFLREIAKEHAKLVRMSSNSAKYWLLETVSKLAGFGEEVFSGITVCDPITPCEVSVGPHGIKVTRDQNQIR